MRPGCTRAASIDHIPDQLSWKATAISESDGGEVTCGTGQKLTDRSIAFAAQPVATRALVFVDRLARHGAGLRLRGDGSTQHHIKTHQGSQNDCIHHGSLKSSEQSETARR